MVGGLSMECWGRALLSHCDCVVRLWVSVVVFSYHGGV